MNLVYLLKSVKGGEKMKLKKMNKVEELFDLECYGDVNEVQGCVVNNCSCPNMVTNCGSGGGGFELASAGIGCF